MQPPPPGHVYGFRCLRCGNALELPADMRLMYIDCPFCGQDNLLPPELVQARQRQYELDQQRYALQIAEQDRVRAEAERDKVRRQSSQRLLIWLLVGGFFGLALLGSCVALGFYLEKKDDEQKLRASDPRINGQAALLARLAEMKKTQGCERILVQPATHVKEASTISLDMVKNAACVHILGMTGTQATLSMRYRDSVALTRPLPPAGSVVDYRLCASETATHTFDIEAVPASEPFTTAAIECPRLPAEGGARSGPDDPKLTGKALVQTRLEQLVRAGCRNIVSQPKVDQGDQSINVTSPANAACYNFLAASGYPDVKLSVELVDPSGKRLPVPDPAAEMRVEYCAPKAGEYKLSVTPSTADYFAWAGVDCNRFGAEGLKRLNKLVK